MRGSSTPSVVEGVVGEWGGMGLDLPLHLGALGWGRPLAAWGLLALLVPLLLHLLVRRRAPEVVLPSLRFLLPRAPARARVAPPSDRPLLLLRLALVALAVVALADPRWSGGEAAAPSGERGGGVESPDSLVARASGPSPASGGSVPLPPPAPDPGFVPEGGGVPATHPRVLATLEGMGVPREDLVLALSLTPHGVAALGRIGRSEEGAATLGPTGSPWEEDGGGWSRPSSPGGESDGGDEGREAQALLRLDPDRWPDTPETAALLLRVAAEARRHPLEREPARRDEGRGGEGLAAPPQGDELQGAHQDLARGREGEEVEGRPLRPVAWALVLLLLLVEGRVRGRGDEGESA